MAKQRHMRRLLEIVSAVATLALGSGAQPVTAGGMIQIVAAENFYGDLAQQIGGKHVSVTSILSNPDDDPHLFETSASTARALAGAEIVIYNGADYDPWMGKLLSASTAQDRVTIVAADLVGAKKGDNPHLWYNPKTLPAIASTLAAELEKRDPANAAEYKANLATFDAAFVASHSADSIVKILTKGKNEDMKSFKDKLTPAQMADVAAYVRDLSAKGMRTVAEGRYATVLDIEAAFDTGAWSVVVGTAITDPVAITRQLVRATPRANNDLDSP